MFDDFSLEISCEEFYGEEINWEELEEDMAP